MLNAISLKEELLKSCFTIQQQRIENFRKAMEDAQQAANSEEKSTAGDKYDTSRAMSQNTRDMNAKLLQEALKDLKILQQIKSDSVFPEARSGSVVITDNGNYFISISAGQVKIGKDIYFAISPLAPIAQAMLHKKKGDNFSFRNTSYVLKDVF